jgi:hypothetical protein
MKGPRSRHKFCCLRVWECRLCRKRVMTAVKVAQRACHCLGGDRLTWMSVVEEPRR